MGSGTSVTHSNLHIFLEDMWRKYCFVIFMNQKSALVQGMSWRRMATNLVIRFVYFCLFIHGSPILYFYSRTRQDLWRKYAVSVCIIHSYKENTPMFVSLRCARTCEVVFNSSSAAEFFHQSTNDHLNYNFSRKMWHFSQCSYSTRFLDNESIRNQNWFKKWLGADLVPRHFSKQCWQKPMLHARRIS